MNSLDEARFFVDEDIAGLGIALMRLRRDVVLGGHEPLADFAGKVDEQWIPEIADRGLVVITNDKHIRTRWHEAKAAIKHNLRCVHLAPKGVKDPTQWDFLIQLLSVWHEVDDTPKATGPRWWRPQGTKLKELPYAPGNPPNLPSNTGSAHRA